MSQPVRIKRIYKAVAVKPKGAGYCVTLDGREARTLTRAVLAAPSENLAAAVAAEWAAQGELIERQTMPLTALLSAAIDAGETGAAEWRTETLTYLGSDLVCYRAETPAALTARQSQVWDPYIDWLDKEFGVRLAVTQGVIAIAQPGEAITEVARALEAPAAFTLFGITTVTKISGSAVLALALWKDAWPADDIFAASRLDEHFQEQRWGADAEAKAREQQLQKDFVAVAEFMRLMKDA
ncbi:MAG: ATPase [Alphaproteobacteria bacterium]|nr:ATPase [Alphaproteobacteria bacterium]